MKNDANLIDDVNSPQLTTILELFQLYIIMPDYYKGPGLYAGDKFPRGTTYLRSDGSQIKIPKNAVFMGTNTMRNQTSENYVVNTDGVLTPIPPNSEVTLPNIEFPVTNGIYTENLVINDTLTSRYVVAGLQNTEYVHNQTPYTIIAINNGKTHYVLGMTIYEFVTGTVGIIVPPGCEVFAENGVEIIEASGSTNYENRNYIQVTHLSNTSNGLINDIQASNNTINNTSSFTITVPMAATETNTIYNQSNAPIKVNSGSLTYMLQVNQVRQFNYDATIELPPNIQVPSSDPDIQSYRSGTQAVNNYHQVIVQTVDFLLRPIHTIKPPALDDESKRKDEPPASQLLGVDTSAINPHVNFVKRVFRDATNSLFFMLDGVVEGTENTFKALPTTIEHLPADILDIPHVIKRLPADTKSIAEAGWKVEKKTNVYASNKYLFNALKPTGSRTLYESTEN